MERRVLDLLFHEELDYYDGVIQYDVYVHTSEEDYDVNYVIIYQVTPEIINRFNENFGELEGITKQFYVVRTLMYGRHTNTFMVDCWSLEAALKEARDSMIYFLSDYSYDLEIPKKVECVYHGDKTYYSIYEEALRESK